MAWVVRGYDYVASCSIPNIFSSDYDLESYSRFSNFLILEKQGNTPHILGKFPKVRGLYIQATQHPVRSHLCVCVRAYVCMHVLMFIVELPFRFTWRTCVRVCVCTCVFFRNSRSDSCKSGAAATL